MNRKPLSNRQIVIVDLLLLSLTPTLALSLRLGVPWDPRFNQALVVYTLLSLLVKMGVFSSLGMYRKYWPYASVDALLIIVWAVGGAGLITSGVVFAGYSFGLLGSGVFPRSLPVIDTMLTLLAAAGTRLSLRISEYYKSREDQEEQVRRVMIAGAGEAGRMVAREIQTSQHIHFKLVGFVDDDPAKIGNEILGIQVLGTLDSLPYWINARDVDQVLIAMASVEGSVIRKVVQLCEGAGITPKSLPGIYELMTGQVSVSRLRTVRIEDLLRRELIALDMDGVKAYLEGKRVLVTGAGGSIGTEICRQICRCQPERLLALDQDENSLFLLSEELKTCRGWEGKQSLELLVADVRARDRVEWIFARWQPQVVFHAAAYKHVPLMEENVSEAVLNNIGGLQTVVEVGRSAGVERFVFISSDKAVEPVSVMGMTKRIGEILVQAAGLEVERSFVSVRFGNVLGSRGSVVPLFQRQIAAGGPVTVTHPEVKRYFLSLSEAVGLVLQAASLGDRGALFFLEMGDQIEIRALAEQLIKLSGPGVGKDIEIVYTGLRPGERLEEKLYAESEKPVSTGHQKIFQIEGSEPPDPVQVTRNVDRLIRLAREGNHQEIRERLAEMASF